MNIGRLMVCNLAAMGILLAVSSLGQAQANRTWVSGTGNDANPCSRTAPCQTLANAISKTASGGQINVLDPDAVGAVTITKPITISSECTEAGILASLTDGIVVNVPTPPTKSSYADWISTGLARV